MDSALARLHRIPLHVAIPVGLFFLLSLLGVTQSSIGVDYLRQDPANPLGTQLGEALTIRSDEFLTSTPIDIGVTASGSTEDLNPLTAPQGFFTQLPAGPVSSVVLIEGTALRLGTVLPDAMLVAARWWLPFLALFLAAPPFFRALTGSRRIGYFAAVLVAASPATAWWSFTPVEIIGFALAGAAALQQCVRRATERARWRSAGWGLLAALLLARTPLYYQPWAIVLVTAVVLVASVGVLVPADHRRARVVALAGTGAGTLGLLALVVLENIDGVRASLQTLYPGERVATGGPNGLQEIFAATNLGRLGDYTTITGTSASEISSSYAVAAVWAALLLASRLAYRDQAHRAAVWAAAATTGFWFAWASIDFGSLGERLPLANLVPAGRAADVLGYLAVLLLCLTLPAVRPRPGLGLALLAATLTAGVAAHAGSLLRAQNIPEMSLRWIWFCAAALALVVFLITWRPRQPAGYVVAGLAALSLVWNVNPVIFGLGDLRDSDVAQAMLAAGDEARATDTVWASDAFAVDSLLVATGVPSLSGRQMAGPEPDAWDRLDPTGEWSETWNRGGSYIWLSWADQDEITMTNPSPDVILVQTGPCVLAEREPQLERLISSRELDEPCLELVDRFSWGGADRWLYAVGP